ncbi:MAG: DUF302 domain-containing protein [Campylobacterales bacterium]|nr:DUF302 domain-containing protein [Campylobacterales bacterium]
MNLLKNILSVVGGLVLVALFFAYIKFDLGKRADQAADLDPKAMALYMAMADNVLNTGDAAKAMIRRVKVKDGVDVEDVVESLNAIAEERNLLVVGSSLMSGGSKGGKYIRINSYCNPTIAKQFINHSMAYSAFMPCRVSIVEDDNGDIWLYTMDLGLMIAGGHTLPPKLLEQARFIEDTMYMMMEKAAAGDF